MKNEIKIKLYGQCIPINKINYFDKEYCYNTPLFKTMETMIDLQKNPNFLFSEDCKLQDNKNKCMNLNCFRSKIIIELFKTYANLKDKKKSISDWGVAVSPGSTNWNSDDDITILMTSNYSVDLRNLCENWPEKDMNRLLDCNLYIEPCLIETKYYNNIPGTFYKTDIPNKNLYIIPYDFNSFKKELKVVRKKFNKKNEPKGSIIKQFELCNETWKNIMNGDMEKAWRNLLEQRKHKDAAYQTNSAYVCVVLGNQMKININKIKNYELMYLIAALENIVDLITNLKKKCKNLRLNESTSIDCYKILLKNSKYILRIFIFLKECINRSLLNYTDIMEETCNIEIFIKQLKEIVSNRGNDINNNLKKTLLEYLSEILTCLSIYPKSTFNSFSITVIFEKLYKKINDICSKLVKSQSNKKTIKKKRRNTKIRNTKRRKKRKNS